MLWLGLVGNGAATTAESLLVVAVGVPDGVSTNAVGAVNARVITVTPAAPTVHGAEAAVVNATILLS